MNWRYQLQDYYHRVKYAYQRAFKGFDETAYWGLYSYITDIALPVLKFYRSGKGISAYPCVEGINNREDWEKALDKMIKSFEIIKKDEYVVDWKIEKKITDEGLQLFAKHFRSLWD